MKKGRVFRGLIAMLVFALRVAGCGAATGAGSAGAGSAGAGAGAAGTAGAAVQTEVEGLDKDLNSLTPDTPVDPDAEPRGSRPACKRPG